MAASIGNAEAKNTLYGKFRLANTWGTAETAAGVESNSRAMNNLNSRLGFKGESANDKFTAFYHAEMKLANDGGAAPATRFFYGGLKGEKWGSVKYGQMTSPYKMPGLKMDSFYDTPSHNSAGAAAAAATLGLSSLNNGWRSNQFHFTSNKYFGATFNLGTVGNENATDQTADTYAGFSYTYDMLSFGVQHLMAANGSSTGMTTDDTAMRIHAQYKADSFRLAVSSESINDDSASETAAFLYVVGDYNVNDKSRVSFSYGTQKDDFLAAGLDGNGMNFGYFFSPVANTEVYAMYSATSFDDDSKSTGISVGFNHSFSSDL